MYYNKTMVIFHKGYSTVLHVHMPDGQQWEVFGSAVLYSFIQNSAAVRFFEYAANSAGGERLRREGETSRSRGETGDIILLNEIKGLSKMSLVALCFVLQNSL